MGKKSASEPIVSPSSESHGVLRGLIDALHQLVIMISSRLRHSQIHGSAMGDAKSDYDLGKKLRSHIEKISVDRELSAKPHTVEKVPTAEPNVKSDSAATAQESSRIAEHIKQKATSQLLPRMNEKLQSNTMEHINISLILAREGNIEGAKLHIDLAENAMHAASRFMSHEEYEIFKQKVERRMDAIVDRDRRNDSGS
jgi:hypothetical protein